MIFIPASWRFLWDSMYNEEINSDLFGATCLVDFFNESDPASVARDFLMWNLTESETRRIDFIIIVMKILGTYPDYHPSVNTRIEKIRENFPSLYPQH